MDEHFWSNQINTPAINTWMGVAYERICLEHVNQIKIKLCISGVLTEVNTWYCKADPDRGLFGSQHMVWFTMRMRKIFNPSLHWMIYLHNIN